jgi:hypothetical protein
MDMEEATSLAVVAEAVDLGLVGAVSVEPLELGTGDMEPCYGVSSKLL